MSDRPRGESGSTNARMAEAHALYENYWDLPNILPNEDARRCVAHYGELWCLHQAQILLGTLAMSAAITNGGLVRTRETSPSSLSIGLVNYNFAKTMKNNFTEFVDHHLEKWIVLYHKEELALAATNDYQNMKRLTMFVHKDLTPECLFKQCEADADGRTSHTEVICHDVFAAMAEQFGMSGAKSKADEKKHRQSNLNELMDKGRLTREKLQESTSTTTDLINLHRAMTAEGPQKGLVARVNLIIVASINVHDMVSMKKGTQGSQEMATIHRFLVSTFPVYNAYAEPSPHFEVPGYLEDPQQPGKPRRDRAGWLRHQLKEPALGTRDNLLTKMLRICKLLGTHGEKRLRNPVITFDQDAMALFRWIDSACQAVACSYQYVEPEVAAELRNINRMLGKLCALFSFSMRILSCVSEPAVPAPRRVDVATLQVTKQDVVRSTLFLATLEIINGRVFRQGAADIRPEDLTTSLDADIDRMLLARVVAPQAVRAYIARSVSAMPPSGEGRTQEEITDHSFRVSILQGTLLWPGRQLTAVQAARGVGPASQNPYRLDWSREKPQKYGYTKFVELWKDIVGNFLVDASPSLGSWEKHRGGQFIFVKLAPTALETYPATLKSLEHMGVTMAKYVEQYNAQCWSLQPRAPRDGTQNPPHVSSASRVTSGGNSSGVQGTHHRPRTQQQIVLTESSDPHGDQTPDTMVDPVDGAYTAPRAAAAWNTISSDDVGRTLEAHDSNSTSQALALGLETQEERAPKQRRTRSGSRKCSQAGGASS